MIKLLIVEDDASLAYIEKTGLEDIIAGNGDLATMGLYHLVHIVQTQSEA